MPGDLGGWVFNERETVEIDDHKFSLSIWLTIIVVIEEEESFWIWKAKRSWADLFLVKLKNADRLVFKLNVNNASTSTYTWNRTETRCHCHGRCSCTCTFYNRRTPSNLNRFPVLFLLLRPGPTLCLLFFFFFSVLKFLSQILGSREKNETIENSR